MAKQPNLITTAEFARQINVSLRTVRNYFHRGIIAGYRFGRNLHFDKSEVAQLLNKARRVNKA